MKDTRDSGQRYEVTYLDKLSGLRLSLGCTDEPAEAMRLVQRVLANPEWDNPQVRDRKPSDAMLERVRANEQTVADAVAKPDA
jgi:hypothetical protein